MTENKKFRQGDALLIIDVQNDFCPGGALPIENGDAVVPVLNEWISSASQSDTPVSLSRDWHPAKHMSFESEGGDWPSHCIQDTDGASFHPELSLPEGAVVVTKGTRFDKDQHSAFDETGLDDELRKRGIGRVWVAGLALDVCVHATALDAVRAGFEVHLIEAATRPVTSKGGAKALEELKRAGVIVE